MLVIHQAVLIPSMKTNLLSPMQLRDNSLRVNDEPKFMALNPTEDMNAITINTTKDDEDEGIKLRIPLSIKGVIGYFPSRKPTRQEWDQSDLSMRIDLTADDPVWDPNNTDRFRDQEAAMLDSKGDLKENWSVIAALNTIPQQEVPMGQFGRQLEGTVRLDRKPTAKEKRSACVGAMRVKSLTTSKREPKIKAKDLARRWSIGLNAAQRTLDATTQHSVRTILHPTLSRRFRTNDRQLR